MAATLKNTRVKPAGATPTALLTVPSGKTIVVSSIVVCNQGGTDTSFRIALRPLGVTLNDSHYLHFDTPIEANDTYIFTGGITAVATDIIEVYATAPNLSFNLFYQENS